MLNKYKVLMLMGKSGAGKDTVAKFNCGKYPELFHFVVSSTTRPKRDYEVDGKDYHFLSLPEFTHKLLNNELIEATEFNNWFYGTSIDSLVKDKINICVLTPSAWDILADDSRIDLLPILVCADDKTRLLRALNREESPKCQEICRRFLADEKDFADLPYGYYILNNNGEQGDAALNLLNPARDFIDELQEMIASLKS